MGPRPHVDDPVLEALRVKEYWERGTPVDQYSKLTMPSRELPHGYAYPPEGFRYTTPAGYPGRYLDPSFRCPSCLERWWGIWKELTPEEMQGAVAYHNRHTAPQAVLWTVADMQDKRWDWICVSCGCAITLVPRMGGFQGLVNRRG